MSSSEDIAHPSKTMFSACCIAFPLTTAVKSDSKRLKALSLTSLLKKVFSVAHSGLVSHRFIFLCVNLHTHNSKQDAKAFREFAGSIQKLDERDESIKNKRKMYAHMQMALV